MSRKVSLTLMLSVTLFYLYLLAESHRPTTLTVEGWNVIRSMGLIFILALFWHFAKVPKDILGLSCGKETKALSYTFKVLFLLLIAGISLLLMQGGTAAFSWSSPDLPLKMLTMIFLYQAIFAPIAEEMLFRGMFQGGLEKSFSPVVAMIVAAIFFAAMHSFGETIILGSIAMGFLRFKTKVLWPSIVVHIAGNASLFVYEFYL